MKSWTRTFQYVAAAVGVAVAIGQALNASPMGYASITLREEISGLGNFPAGMNILQQGPFGSHAITAVSVEEQLGGVDVRDTISASGTPAEDGGYASSFLKGHEGDGTAIASFHTNPNGRMVVGVAASADVNFDSLEADETDIESWVYSMIFFEPTVTGTYEFGGFLSSLGYANPGPAWELDYMRITLEWLSSLQDLTTGISLGSPYHGFYETLVGTSGSIVPYRDDLAGRTFFLEAGHQYGLELFADVRIQAAATHVPEGGTLLMLFLLVNATLGCVARSRIGRR